MEVSLVRTTSVLAVAVFGLSIAGGGAAAGANRAGDTPSRLIAACKAARPVERPRFYAAPERTFCLDGSLTAEDVAGAKALIATSRNLVLRSPGGVGDYYLTVALAAGRIDNTVVHEYCLSACANYLFFVGRNKWVGEGAFVAFHGAPPTDPALQERYAIAGAMHDNPGLTRDQVIARALHLSRLAKARAKTDDLIRRQDILYRRLGVRAAFTRAVNNLYFRFTADQQPGWVPEATTLRQCFGVTGLRQYWRPSDAALSDLASRRYHFSGMVVLAYPTNWAPPCGTTQVPEGAAMEPPSATR
jgi:hypothetical protein